MAVLALVALALVAPFALGTDARHLSAYADGAEDLSEFRAALPASTRALVGTPGVLLDVPEPERALYVAIGPERRYDDSEARAIIDFLKRGGSVLLADETGLGDRIAYEAGFAFEPDRLLDTVNYLGDMRLAKVEARVEPAGGPYNVVLNSPGKLTPLSNVGPHDVLATSSAAVYPNGSYVDNNGNGVIERSDTPGPHALIVRASVGRGTLVLVADTGLFMNAQMALGGDIDNGGYVRALVGSLAPTGTTVYLDESRHAQPATLALWNDAIRTLGRATTGGVAPIALILILLVGAYLAWYYTRETEDWSVHRFDLGHANPAPDDVRADHARLQRMARRRISERYNIPLEQVAAMPAEELHAVTGDRTLADAAAGTLRSDPTPLFAQYAPAPVSSSPEVQ